MSSQQQHEQTPDTADSAVRVGEELHFAALEEFSADSRWMGERNREALDQAEAEGRSYFWCEQYRWDDLGRMHRVWVRTSLVELRHRKRLKELAERHGEVHEDDDGRIRVGKEARRRFRRDWEAGRFRGLQRDIGHGPETHDQWKHRVRSIRGRAPRAAAERHRGSRRGERSKSSSSDDPDPEPQPRVCECGCGASLDHLNADARFLNAAHRACAYRAAQKEEGFEPLSSVPRPCNECPHRATLPDEDGDPVCILCGTLVGTPSSPNGYEVTLADMVTDGDGQRRRVLRRRHIGAARWGGLTTRLPSDAAIRPRPVHKRSVAPVAADTTQEGGPDGFFQRTHTTG